MKIDSQMTFEESVKGSRAPKEVIEKLRLLDVTYFGFEEEHFGQILVRSEVADEVEQIFKELKELKFPIEKVIPIVSYSWDDELSMADNNSSAFNYRLIKGTDRLSKHSFGRAIDINPKINPYIGKNGQIEPAGASYDKSAKGVITEDSSILAVFNKYGWEWGGTWGDRGFFDYHHFEKDT